MPFNNYNYNYNKIDGIPIVVLRFSPLTCWVNDKRGNFHHALHLADDDSHCIFFLQMLNSHKELDSCFYHALVFLWRTSSWGKEGRGSFSTNLAPEIQDETALDEVLHPCCLGHNNCSQKRRPHPTI
jgi:hypothetical protein